MLNCKKEGCKNRGSFECIGCSENLALKKEDRLWNSYHQKKKRSFVFKK